MLWTRLARFGRAMVSVPGVAATAALMLGVAGLLQNAPKWAVPFLVAGVGLTYWVQRRVAPAPPIASPAQHAVAVAKLGKVWNVPMPVHGFAGRGEDLTALRGLLGTSGSRVGVVAVHGLGGVGKTQLGRAYAHQQDPSLAWQIQAGSRLTVVSDLAVLAERLGLPVDRDTERSARAALQALTDRRDWLLIYDNATRPDDVVDLLPTAGQGQVLITSRHPRWDGIAAALPAKPFPTATASSFLQSEVDDYDEVAATALAEELGGLPLALAQASAYCRHPRTRLATYLEVYRKQPIARLSEHTPAGYPEPVARTWLLNMRTAARHPAAVQLLRLMAFLAPVELPRDVLTEAAAVLPRQLRDAATDPARLHAAIGVLTDMSLISADDFDAVRVHQLVQEVTRAQIAAATATVLRRLARRLGQLPPRADSAAAHSTSDWGRIAMQAMVATFPVDAKEVERWDRSALLLPHAYAALTRPTVAPVDIATLQHNLALYLDDRGEYGDARTLLEGALEVRSQALGTEHPATVTSLNNLAVVLRAQGDLDTARDLHRKTFDINLRTHGPDNFATLNSLNNLAEVLRNQGDLDSAHTLHRQTLETRRRTLGSDHLDTVTSLNNFAEVLRLQGDIDAARTLYQEALDTCRRTLGPAHLYTLTSLNNLAVVLRSQGDLQTARTLHQEALDVSRHSLGPEHPHTLAHLDGLAEILRAQGDLDTARALHRQTLETRRRCLGPEHPHTFTSLTNYALVLRDLGDHQAADRHLEELGITLVTAWPGAAAVLARVVARAARGNADLRKAFAAFAAHTPAADVEATTFVKALRKVITKRDPQACNGLPQQQRWVVKTVLDKLAGDAGVDE